MTCPAEGPRFKIRFMRIDEIGRVAELVRALQVHQKMEQVPRIPQEADLMQELVHQREAKMIPNKFGTYTTVAIDTTRLGEDGKAYVVGYMIYSTFYSVIRGRAMYMNSFFITEEYRRNGLGSKFMEFLKVHCKMMGINQLDVPYMNNNVVGQKFYKTFGSYLVNEDWQLVGKQMDLQVENSDTYMYEDLTIDIE